MLEKRYEERNREIEDLMGVNGGMAREVRGIQYDIKSGSEHYPTRTLFGQTQKQDLRYPSWLLRSRWNISGRPDQLERQAWQYLVHICFVHYPAILEQLHHTQRPEPQAIQESDSFHRQWRARGPRAINGIKDRSIDVCSCSSIQVL